MSLNTTEEIIEDLRQGKMVVILDDEDRENEGDLVMAAELVTAQSVNFMARYGRGLICLTLTQERCRQLRLPLMVNENESVHSTNFTVSIEAAEGVTTGISAADRATTVLAAVGKDASPNDLIQPGHIFPLMAQPGGVLVRAGHTEAGCDLSRLAGLDSSAMIVEILNEDGSMARLPDLKLFAQQHELKMGTIADLIHYRIKNEKTIERISECILPTDYGDFRLVAYQDVIGNELHLALVKGELSKDKPALVRVHMQNTLCDLFDTRHAGCGWPIENAMRQIAEEGMGVIVVLRNHDTAKDVIERMREIQFHPAGHSLTNQDVLSKPEASHLRTYGVGAQILADLGIQKMRILSAPKSLHALSGFDLEVVEYVECK